MQPFGALSTSLEITALQSDIYHNALRAIYSSKSIGDATNALIEVRGVVSEHQFNNLEKELNRKYEY